MVSFRACSINNNDENDKVARATHNNNNTVAHYAFNEVAQATLNNTKKVARVTVNNNNKVAWCEVWATLIVSY